MISSIKETGASGRPSVSSECPACGTIRRWFEGVKSKPGGFYHCQPCQNKRRRKSIKSPPATCRACGEASRFQSGECRACHRRREIARGQRLVDQADAVFGQIIARYMPTQQYEVWLTNLSRNGAKWPRPSTLFKGLQPALDANLIAAGLHRDAALCELLATLESQEDQLECLDRYRRNPEQARRWVKLPAWKRPLIDGTKEDQQIWKFFGLFYGYMSIATAEVHRPWEMRYQGDYVARMATVLSYIPMTAKLATVLRRYGYALMYGQPVGTMKKPWEEDPS